MTGKIFWWVGVTAVAFGGLWLIDANYDPLTAPEYIVLLFYIFFAGALLSVAALVVYFVGYIIGRLKRGRSDTFYPDQPTQP